MATTNTTNGIQLLVGAGYLRVFYFGTTGQASNAGGNSSMVVHVSRNGGAFVNSVNTALEIANGFYSVVLTSSTETALPGDLAFFVTATSGGPATWTDQVVTQLFSQLQLDPSFRAYVPSNLRQNQPFTALFFMTQLGTSNPAPGLTVTGQRTFSSIGFSNVSGTILEVGGAGFGAGWYVFNGTAADSAGACGGFKMTSLGANDSDFTLWFQP